jgi:hypothetical protein
MPSLFSYPRFPIDKVVWEALYDAERKSLDRRWRTGLALTFGGLALNFGAMGVALYALSSGALVSVWTVAITVVIAAALVGSGGITCALTRDRGRSTARSKKPGWFTPDGQPSEAGLQLVDPIPPHLGRPAAMGFGPIASLVATPKTSNVSAKVRAALKRAPERPPPTSSLSQVAHRGQLRALPLNAGWRTWRDGPAAIHLAFPHGSPELVQRAFRAILGPLGYSLVFEFPQRLTSASAGRGRPADRALLFERGLMADPKLTKRHDALRGFGLAGSLGGTGVLFYLAVVVAGRGPLLLPLILASACLAFAALTLVLSFAEGRYWSDVVVVSYVMPSGRSARTPPISGGFLEVTVAFGRAFTQDWLSKNASGRKLLAVLPQSDRQAVADAIQTGLAGERPLPAAAIGGHLAGERG